VISKYINERRESKANSLHAFLYRTIKNLTGSKKTLELDFSTIWSFIESNVEYKPITFKPQSIETVEFGVISQKQIGSILKNVFGGVPPKHTGSSRRLIFSQHVLDRMKDIYETVDVDVDFETSESLDDHTSLGFGTDGTDGTDSGTMPTYTVPSELDSKENTENNKEYEKSLEEISIESINHNDSDKEGTDRGALSENVSQVSQLSQTRSQTSSEECDLRNQEGADRFSQTTTTKE
jgi:hypothetical protein